MYLSGAQVCAKFSGGYKKRPSFYPWRVFCSLGTKTGEIFLIHNESQTSLVYNSTNFLTVYARSRALKGSWIPLLLLTSHRPSQHVHVLGALRSYAPLSRSKLRMHPCSCVPLGALLGHGKGDLPISLFSAACCLSFRSASGSPSLGGLPCPNNLYQQAELGIWAPMAPCLCFAYLFLLDCELPEGSGCVLIIVP